MYKNQNGGIVPTSYAVIIKDNVIGNYSGSFANPRQVFNTGDVLIGRFDGISFHAEGMFTKNANGSITENQFRSEFADPVKIERFDNNNQTNFVVSYSANPNDLINLGDGYLAFMIHPDFAFGSHYFQGNYSPNVYYENDGFPYAYYRLKNNFVSNYSNAVINKMNYGKPVAVFTANKYVYGNVYVIAKLPSGNNGLVKYALLTKINPPQGYDFNWLSNTNILNPGGTNYPQYQYAIPLESLYGPVPFGFVLPAQAPPPSTNTEVLPVPMPKPKPSGTSDTTTSTSPKSITTTVSKKRMVGFANE